MRHSQLADIKATTAYHLNNAHAIEPGFHSQLNAVDCAFELLEHLQDPVLLFMPVWSEVNKEKTIVDFTVGFANKEAVARFQIGKAMVLSQLSLDTPVNSALKTVWFPLLQQVVESGASAEKPFYDAQAQTHYNLIGTRVSQGVLLTARNSSYEVQAKKQEKVLQQIDDRVNFIFETAHAGMYTLAPVRNEQGEVIDFRFGLVNQAVASYLGLQAEDLIGSLGSTYFPAYKTNGLFDRYVETLNTGQSITFDLHYADGYDNFFTINVVKMEDELFATFTDHSVLKRLQRDLEASIAELKRSNTSLEQFAHAASHDLQEPLRRIMVYADKLETDFGAELTDNAFGCVERIQTASKRMRRLIQDLLVFAEVGASKNSFEEVNLDQLVQEVVNDLEVAITERDAVVSIEGLGKIKGDSLHLQQLFQNLISNSLKYSRHEVAPQITITSNVIMGKDSGFELTDQQAEKPFCLIQLKDNGQGFTQEQSKQIFKIFQRLPQHRTEYTGTGIGLAIVQRVVENHNGYICAEGVPGEGATFKILLPVTE